MYCNTVHQLKCVYTAQKVARLKVNKTNFISILHDLLLNINYPVISKQTNNCRIGKFAPVLQSSLRTYHNSLTDPPPLRGPVC